MHRCGFIQPEYCNAHAHLFIIIQFYNCWLVPIVVNGRNVEYGAFNENTPDTTMRAMPISPLPLGFVTFSPSGIFLMFK